MGALRDYLNEARDKSVPTEFRIAIGQLKRMYNKDDVPESKELEKDAEMIAKKYHLDADKFLEFAKEQFKLNESEKMVNAIKKLLPKGDLHVGKIGKNKEYVWTFDDGSHIRVTSDGDDRVEYYAHGGEYITSFVSIKQIEKYLHQSGLLTESAVGKPGRTTTKDAEDHIDDELIAEFKKIIKKLGGKTVAKVLLDKLSQKAEIKDEIEHIEDLIDNSNY